jgi:hypothetical protein
MQHAIQSFFEILYLFYCWFSVLCMSTTLALGPKKEADKQTIRNIPVKPKQSSKAYDKRCLKCEFFVGSNYRKCRILCLTRVIEMPNENPTVFYSEREGRCSFRYRTNDLEMGYYCCIIHDVWKGMLLIAYNK